jgi:hypothetical protein
VQKRKNTISEKYQDGVGLRVSKRKETGKNSPLKQRSSNMQIHISGSVPPNLNLVISYDFL